MRALLVLALATGCRDLATLDADAAPPEDAPAVTSTCAPDATLDCHAVAPIWQTGTAAICAGDGTRWDVTACRAAAATERVRETVVPARRDKRWRGAQCSHLGDFPFTISIPPDPDGSWRIELGGGGFCAFDGDDPRGGCSQRDRSRVEPVHPDGSPFDPDGTVVADAGAPEPGFERAIVVSAHYCSNDLWTGANRTGMQVHYPGAAGPQAQFVFVGHDNVEAMLAILIERYGLDDAHAQVLLHGVSAGGWGALNNAYTLARRLPQTAARGDLLVSSFAGFVPMGWNNGDFPVLGRYASARAAFRDLVSPAIWGSALAPACTAAFAGEEQDCISGDTLYDTITTTLDLPLLVYQNRQDQLYMSIDGIPPVTPVTPEQVSLARAEFVGQLDAAMGITGADSTRIHWLFAPSDPVIQDSAGQLEPNVHPPLCYDRLPPDGADNSLGAMSQRFWQTMRGQPEGRGRAGHEVHVYATNFVTSTTCP